MSTILCLIITIIGWAVSQNLWKIACKTLPPPAIPLIGALCSMMLLPVYYWILRKTSVPTALTLKLSWQGITWAAAGYLVSAIGTLTYMYVLSQKDVSQTVSIVSVYPALTFLVAVIFMGEAFSFAKFIGLLLVLAGIFVASRGG